MCFSQYTEYAPRPVKEEMDVTVVRPEGAPPSKAELDGNLFGPKPTPPEWTVAQAPANGHAHAHAEAVQDAPKVAVQAIGSQANGSTPIASVSTQTVEAVVVELANGTKLLICPL